MTARIAINGYGRIGRSVLRALYECGYRNRLQPAAINDPAPLVAVSHLTRYDTVHGKFPIAVEEGDDCLRIAGDEIQLSGETDPARLPWRDLDVDIVLECTGQFRETSQLALHLDAGAHRVLLSQPGAREIPAVVWGINSRLLQTEASIISSASCTTNAVVPVIAVLDRTLGIERGAITTLHSAMNDQPVLDCYRPGADLRLMRAAGGSMIPVDTQLAQGISRILPHLEGRFSASALRVPVLNVSAMNLSVQVCRDTSAEEVNQLLAAAGQDSFLAGILGYSEEPLPSCDFNHDPRSGIVDAGQTRVSHGRLVTTLTWFDNEWGFANRMLDLASAMAEIQSGGDAQQLREFPHG